jgi:hypothetical protein
MVACRCALLGDRLAGLAAQHGWAGIVLSGCVRDTAALSVIDVGIKALAPCPRKSSKRDPGLKAVRWWACRAQNEARQPKLAFGSSNRLVDPTSGTITWRTHAPKGVCICCWGPACRHVS